MEFRELLASVDYASVNNTPQRVYEIGLRQTVAVWSGIANYIYHSRHQRSVALE